MISQPENVLFLWADSVCQEPPSVLPPRGVITEPSSQQELRLQQSRVIVRLWRRNVVLVKFSLRPHVVNDGGELPLAQRADGLHLGPLQEAGETELVPAGICDGLV